MGRITSRLANRALAAGLLFWAFAAVPAVATTAAPKAEEKKPALSVADFSYSSQDRRDPFEQVHVLKTRSKDTASKETKSGYELEELKLVGVVKTGAVTFAVMEDTQGKGMMFKKGDFLNNNLWLFDFLQDKVLFAYKLKGDVRKIPVDIPRK
jgi:Tfp pilus assembly protein PilP